MKKLILSILLTFTLITASSQKVYFIYIQTESGQPFFVIMNEKIHNSTGTGYLILSKLIDSSYNFSIGFPQNKWLEQKFSVAIDKKDQGFILKNFGEKGWGLFNLQTSAVQMSSNVAAKTNTPVNSDNKDISKFTEILSKVADDPTIREKPVQPKVVEKKPEVVALKIEKKEEQIVREVEPNPVKIDKPTIEKTATSNGDVKPADVIEKKVIEKTEPVIAKKEVEDEKPVEVVQKVNEAKNEPKVEIEKKDIAIDEIDNRKSTYESYNPSKVNKWAESSTTEGFGIVFIDDYNNGVQDTIRLLIPNPKQIEVPVVNNEKPKEEKKFIDIENTDQKKKEESILTEVKPIVSDVTTIEPVLSNNCTLVAEEEDFFKLRKQMAAKESNDEMLGEAKMYFKAKCFTSEQIKNLGSLFLTDESKYKFFDVAYSYVSDAEKFPLLQAELKDEYFINRFRAMLRN